jgi:hypothetical protein
MKGLQILINGRQATFLAKAKLWTQVNISWGHTKACPNFIQVTGLEDNGKDDCPVRWQSALKLGDEVTVRVVGKSTRHGTSKKTSR